MLAENVNRALAGLQGKAVGHHKIALESTLRLHNDGAAGRVSPGKFQSPTGIPDPLCKIATLPLKGAGKGVGIEGSLAARHFRLGDFALG